MDESAFVLLLALAINAAVCGGIGYVIGKSKNRGSDGAALGALLGVIGIVIALSLKEKTTPQKWKPGQYAAKADPFEEFEMRQKSATILAPPAHLKKNSPPPENGEGE